MSECRPDNGEGAGGKTGANTCNNSFGKVPCGCSDSISISYVIQAGCLGTMLGVDDHIFGSPYNTDSAELGWSYISPEKDSCHF